MTCLLFTVADRSYGLDVRDVVMVLPVPRLRPVDGSPDWFPGVFRFRQELVAAVDVARLLGHEPARQALGTRAILVRHTRPGAAIRLVALVAENVSDIVDLDAGGRGDVATSPLGTLITDAAGRLVQIVTPERLVPDELWTLLAPETDQAVP
jgi:chemotaxis signal transduction protein